MLGVNRKISPFSVDDDWVLSLLHADTTAAPVGNFS